MNLNQAIAESQVHDRIGEAKEEFEDRGRKRRQGRNIHALMILRAAADLIEYVVFYLICSC